MTQRKAKRLFNEFVITYNDAVQKTMDIYLNLNGDFPDSLLPDDRSVMLEAFKLLVDQAKEVNDDNLSNYQKAIIYLDRFVQSTKNETSR